MTKDGRRADIVFLLYKTQHKPYIMTNNYIFWQEVKQKFVKLST